jgi:hypothetical protein
MADVGQSNLMDMWAQRQDPNYQPPGQVATAAASAGNGALMGFGPEVLATIRAIHSAAKEGTAANLHKHYDTHLQEANNWMGQAQHANPDTAFIANEAGGVAPMLMPGAGLVGRGGAQVASEAMQAPRMVDNALVQRARTRIEADKAHAAAQADEANIQAMVDFHNAQTAHFEGSNALKNNLANVNYFDKSTIPMSPSRFAEDVAARKAAKDAQEQHIQDAVDFHDAQTAYFTGGLGRYK